ncbi:nuclear transport factor 2 family protein [Sphingomonas sp. MMS24-J13]|uniref:nuclear transport factor 2 family protein n=1 Tax=Sphingomonas sp. MMS24-J13 TaxID=3238686 RepID=UPI00384AC287
MSHIHRRSLAAIGVLTMTFSPALASTADDSVDVDHLISAYHQAVVSHDAPRLAALFLPTGTAWFSVLSDEGLKQARAKSPDTPKLKPGSVDSFVKLVATSPSRLDPQHTNLQVRSDGAIATVTFDFSFLIDGKEQNRGTESWQLVKGVEGWRIASIIYSSNPPKG